MRITRYYVVIVTHISIIPRYSYSYSKQLITGVLKYIPWLTIEYTTDLFIVSNRIYFILPVLRLKMLTLIIPSFASPVLLLYSKSLR